VDDLRVEIEVFDLVKIDDIFSDGSLLKRLLRSGTDQQKPEKISKMKFDLEIRVGSNVIYTSTPPLENAEDVIKGVNNKVYINFTLKKFFKKCLKKC
jgi:hypothetical protein